jgi:putative peptidoglycan lipid II flippase
LPIVPDSDQAGYGLPTLRTQSVVVFLAIIGKGIAFIREPVIASVLGASFSSDAYYLATGIPFLVFNLAGLPFSLWVTARLATVTGQEATRFYYRALLWTALASIGLALGFAGFAGQFIRLLAPGLDYEHRPLAVAALRLGAIALPALVLQGLIAGRLFAAHRFAVAYLSTAFGSIAGLLGVLLLTPRSGVLGAVVSFSGSWWLAALTMLVLVRRDDIIVDVERKPWAGDLGPGVVYRAALMQLFFQGSALLVYNFSSQLATGDIAAVLFASKVTMAVYETVVLTAGVLVFPYLARSVQARDPAAAWDGVNNVLHWLLPATVLFALLLVALNTEIVAVIYERRAFDADAVRRVSKALLGYAPYIIGITIVEVFHRAMVLWGRVREYIFVFVGALVLNWVASRLIVPRLGVTGVALGSSVGVIAAGALIGTYAYTRLAVAGHGRIGVLLLRNVIAGGVVLIAVFALKGRVPVPSAYFGQVVHLLGIILVSVVLFAVALAVLGYRWRWFSRRQSGSPG